MEQEDALEVVDSEKIERLPASVLVVNEESELGWVPERYQKRQGKRAIVVQESDTLFLRSP